MSLIKRIEDAGVRFTETTYAGLIKKLMPKLVEEKGSEEMAVAAAGAFAISTGRMLRTLGVFFFGFSILMAGVSPLTLVAGAGYLLAAAGGGAAFFFGKGMEKGGDNLSGLLTFQKELRHGVAEAAKEEFRNWREKKFGKTFKAAAEPAVEQPVGAAPAKTVAPAIKSETGGP